MRIKYTNRNFLCSLALFFFVPPPLLFFILIWYMDTFFFLLSFFLILISSLSLYTAPLDTLFTPIIRIPSPRARVACSSVP